MVQLRYSVLAFALTTQLVCAFPKPDAGSTIQQRRGGPNDQFVFAICPRDPKKCSECGGDTKKKGFCDNEIATGYRSDYNDCVKWHGEGEGCGLICECISEETGEPGTGAPPIIPFPPIPVGFAPPPAAVPNPKTEDTCGNDYTQTSCKDCEPLDGWCTKGDHAGCPCREECRADDDDTKPTCSADDCKGEKGSCTIGHYKGCNCKSECPNPDEKILVCSDDICKSEADSKCSTDENNGCGCYHLTTDYYTRRSKAQVQDDSKAIAKLVESMKKFYDEQGEGDEDDEPKEPEVTCASKDYSAAIDVDASFLNKLADKFCSGEVDKKRSQDLTAKDISSGAYEGYKFHFELDPGDNCKTDCKAAFKSMTGKCQGIDSHSIQKSASSKVPDCGASFSYKITAPETDPDTFTQEGEQERVCHDADQFGSHGDVRAAEVSRAAMSCLGVDDGEAQFTAESEPFTSKSTYGGTQMAFTMSWVDNCEGDSLDVRNPSGKSDKLGDSCWKFMLDNWEQCNNGGAGGYIDYGCVRYDFRPSFD